jgi:hypothetical protein
MQFCCRVRRNCLLACPVAVHSPVSARATNFFLTGRICTKLCQPAQPEIFFRSQPSKRVRAPCRFFLPQPRSSAGSAEIFFCAAFSVAAQQTFFCCLPHRRYAANLFFGCPVASAQQSARTKYFFWPHSSFCSRLVSSAQHLFDFCGFWNLLL